MYNLRRAYCLVDAIYINSTVVLFIAFRIQSFGTSFSVVSVGQLQMTGPLTISFPQTSDTHIDDNEYITMLIHWNPGI